MKYLIKPICLFLFLTSFFHVSAQYSPLNVIIKESNGNVAAHATDGVKLTNSVLPYNYLWKLDGKLIDGKTDSTFLKCDLNTLLKGKEPKKTIKYGRLYNWYATQGVGNKSIAPEGWHVPTDLEWSLLTDYVGGPTKAGAKLKETGTTYWKAANSEATNEVGFCARPGGLLSGNRFSSITDLGSWWSSTADNTYNGRSRKLIYSDNAEITESIDKKNGKSIRCIKDAKSKVFAFCAPLDFDPTMQPVNIIDVFNSYQNQDKKYIVSFRDDLDKLALTQGTNVAYGYEIGGVKHVDNYNVVQTALNGTLAAGNYTEIPVASTSGFPESGIIRYYDTGTYYYNFERFHIFRYTSKTPTSFIGENQPVTEAAGNILPVIDLVGTNRYLIVNSPTLESVELYDNNGAKNVQLPGITSGVSVAAFNCFEWLYCGKSINHIAGGNCGIGYGSVKYIHLENETQLTLLGYTDFYGVPLTGELNIPKSISSIGSQAGWKFWVGFGAGYLTKVTIGQNVTMIVDNFNSHNTIQRFDCYPLIAPRIIDVGAFMNNDPVPLHIREDATGYNVSPWNDTNVFSEIIRDLKPIRDEDFVSLTDSTVTDIDGNVYKTLAIGSQIWMDKNLSTTRYRNGDPILQNFSGTTDAVSSYNNDKNNVFDISKTYDISVSTTDQNSISASDTLAITPADSLLVNIADSISITTNGGRGTLVAHARGGERLIDSSLPYTYSWKLNGNVIEGKTDSVLLDIPAGNYSVEITDNCGNIAKDSFTLQAKLEVKLNESNGVIAAHATGGIRRDGNLPYNYTWKLDGEVIAGQTDSTILRCDLNSFLKGRTLKEITTKLIKYGRLYNWDAATDPRRIAPDGWHVPTQKEWVTLINYCGGIHIAGIKLRSPELWRTSTYHYVPGTDDYNFKAYAGGYYNGGYSYLGQSAEFGCSDATIGDINFGTVGKRIILTPDYEQYGVGGFEISNNWFLYSLASIRLVKDNNTNEGDIVIDGNTYNPVTIGTQVWLQQNLAVKHYQNGDLIGSDFSGTVGAVTSYNNDESNVYDTKVTTSKTFDLSVTVSDQNAITAKESLALLPPDSLSVNLNNSIAITAYGGKGTLVAHAQGGVERFNSSLPYSYRWKRNGVVLADKIDSVLTDIPAGNYSVEITDNCERTVTDSFTLLDPLGVEINVSHQILSNAGTGTLVANVKGGVKFKTGLPYRYTWYQGDFDTELEGKTDSILSDVGVGTYSVEIWDSTGTSEGMSFTFTQPEKLGVKISESQPILTNDGVGTLVANATGGVKPYSYAWYRDNVVLDNKVDSSLLNMSAGNYRVQITDSNKITVSSSFTFIKHDSLKVSIVESNSMPYKGGIGTLVALASGGVKQDNNSHYNYTWKLNGEVIEGETDSVISLCQLNSYLDGKPKETILKTIKYGYLYNGYVIYDNRKITSSDEWIVPNTNIGYSLVSYTGTQLKEQGNSHWINGGGDNSVGFNLRPSGYRYSAYGGVFSGVGVKADLWCTGALNQYNSQACIRYGGTNWFIGADGLASGMAIRICREATNSELSLSNGTAVAPYIGSDGVQYKTVKIDSYVWTSENLIETKFRNGDKIPVITNGVSWQSAIASALCSYDNDETNAFSAETIINSFNLSITVTDKNTIAATDSFALTKPDLLEVNITASTSILGNGGKGTLVATAKGGVKLVGKSTLYNYVWSQNGKVIDGKTDSILSEAGAGEYNVEISDNCGNTVMNSFTLTQPEKLDVKVSESTPLLNSESTSTLVAHSSGGVKFATGTPYKYQWFKEDVKLDDKTDSTLLDVPAGKYTVQITDANNITASFLFTLIQHDVLNVQIFKSINNNGDSILIVHGTGGVKLDNNLPYNYSYSWDVNGGKIEGETDSIISLCDLYKYLNGKEPATITDKTIKYGRLYNWYAATDPRGIAPVGWHVPSLAEWLQIKAISGINSPFGNVPPKILGYYGTCDVESGVSFSGISYEGRYATTDAWINDPRRCHVVSLGGCVDLQEYNTSLHSLIFIKDNSTLVDSITDIDGNVYSTLQLGSLIITAQPSAVTRFNNHDLIPVLQWNTAQNSTVPYVSAYNRDENNVYDTVETKVNKFDIGVTITDKNAATATNSYALAKMDLLEVKITASNTILSYGGKATLTATAKGGIRLINSSLPYNYTWKLNGQVIDGKNDSVLSDMPAGNYSVEINDKCGIVATDTFALTQPDSFKVRILVTTPILSNGNNTGTLVAHATGGTRLVDNYMPYNYTWYQNGAEISSGDSILYNAYAGKYSVEISDANGIIVTDSFTQPDMLVLKMSELVPLLNSESAGTLAACATGGIKFKTGLPYRYTWYQGADFETELDGQTDSILSDVGAGIYSVEIMDSTGNWASISSYKFIPHDTLKVKISESVPIFSNGGVGTLVARGTGGVKSDSEYRYNYCWYRDGEEIGVYDSIMTNAVAGNYSVMIYDANSNTATDSYVLTQPEELSVEINASHPILANAGTGTLVAHGTGGVKLDNNLPYNYIWNVNGEKIEGETDSIISLCNLYQYLNGREPKTITQKTITQKTITQKTIKCGRLYNWYAATDSRSIAPVGWHVPSDAEWQTLIDFAGGNSVAGGKLKEIGMSHWYGINTGATNEFDFSALPGGIVINNGSTHSNMGAGGNWWSSTENDLDNASDIIIMRHVTNVYSSGNEKYIGESIRLIKDNSTNEGDIIIDGDLYHTVTIGTQVWLQQNLATTKYRDGSVIGSDFSGTTGAVTAYNNDESNVYDTVETKDNKFDIGVTITDKNAATATNSYALAKMDLLEVKITASNTILSYGGKATLTVTAKGGVRFINSNLSYNFIWKLNGQVIEGQTDSVLSDMPAGNYSVEISDQCGIVATDTFSLIQPDPFNVKILVANPILSNGNTGTLVAHATGGTRFVDNYMPYNYTWFQNGAEISSGDSIYNGYAGKYSVEISDANGIIVTDSFTLTQPDMLVLKMSELVPLLNSESAGTLAACATGGIKFKTGLPYRYIWYQGADFETELDGQTNSILSDVGAGIYSVEIMDSTGNWASISSYKFIPHDTLKVKISESVPISSNGGVGTLVARGTGGVKSDSEYRYNYCWYRDGEEIGVYDSIMTNAVAGNYSVMIYDANSNTATDSYVLTQPEELSVEINASHPILGNGGTGTLVANGKGGVKFKTGLPYRYTWYQGDFDTQLEGQTDSILSDVGTGMYSVEIMDSTETSVDMSFTLTEPEKLEVEISETQPLLTNDGVGTLVAICKGGVKPYSYAWYKDNGILNGKADATLSDIPAGNYSVQITDSNKITVSSSFTLIKHDSLKVSIVESIAMPYKGSVGTLVALASGGVKQDNNPPYNYSYSWKLNGEVIAGETDSVISLCQLTSYLNDKRPTATSIHPRWDDSGDMEIFGIDRFGFNALPGGMRDANNGSFQGIGSDFILYGRNIVDIEDGSVSAFSLESYNFDCWLYPSGTTKSSGFSIRAVRTATEQEQLLLDGFIGSKYTDYDGNVYQCTKVGTQLWTAQNLKVTHYADGTSIPTNLSDANWAADTVGACAVYGKNDGTFTPTDELTTEELMVAAYGRLYNWYAINNAHGLIDETNGWHVPADTEFTQLTNYLTTKYAGITNDNVGDALKSVRQVNSPFLFCNVHNNLNVTVTDKNAATADNTYTLTKPEALEVEITASASILGYGGKGVLVATAQGGVKLVGKSTLYNYVWSQNGKVLEGKTDSVLLDAGVGEYKVEITDNCGNTVVNTFTLTQPEKLDVKVSELTPLLNSESTSTLMAHGSGGVRFETDPPYKYQWYKEDLKLDDKTDSILLDVPAGKYTVQITDANNITVSFLFTLIQHDVLNVQISKSINNNGDSVLVAHGTGGVKLDNLLYNYSWNIDGDKIEGKTDSILSLCELYNYLNAKPSKLTILQGYIYNGYAKNDTRLITSSNDWEVASVARNSTMPHIGWDILIDYCGTNSLKYLSSGTNDYGFNAQPNGGRANNGEFWSGLQSSNFLYGGFSGYLMGKTFSTDGSIYTGDLIDDAGGSAIRLVRENTSLSNGDKGTYIGNDGFIYPTICIGSQEWMSCNLMETKYRNGDLIPTVTDKTEWGVLRTGAKCAYNNDENNVFDNVNKFNLNVKVADKNAATATNSLVTTRADSLEVKVSVLNGIHVNGGKGTLVAHASGGVKSTPVKPYNYSWYLNGSVLVGKSDSILSGIGAGHYSVSITDNCGTVATDSFTLSQPDKLEATINEITAISYYGGTGSIVVHVNGGVKFPTGLPYSYTWYHEGIELADIKDSILPGVIAGNYSVRITDCNGNEVIRTFKFMEPDPLKVDRESEYAITLSLSGKINTSQIMDSERNWSNIIFSNQAGNEIEDNCYIEKCKVPDFFYYKNNEDKWTISSGGNLSYRYGTVVKFNKTDTTYYDVNCHPNYIKIYTNPIPQKLAGPGYKVENTNLVNSINLIYPYYSDSIDNVYKTSVTNVAMSVSVKPRKFRLYMLDDNSEPVTINESIPLHSSDNITLKASSGFPLELYKWEYGISTESNVIVWKDINPDLQNKETLNFSPSDLVNDSDFINIEDNGGKLFIRIKSESFEGNQIAEIIPFDKAPHFKSVTAIEPSCTGLDNGKIEISFDRALYRGEELKVICDDGSGGDSYTVNSKTNFITINGLLSGKYRLSLIGQMNGYQTNTDESRHLDSATIEAPLPVKYKVRKIENVKCYADSTGEVTFDLSGGTGTYLISYSLKDSTEGELNSHLTQNQIKDLNVKSSFYRVLNNKKISGLVAGKYKFTIHDTNQCDGGIGELEFILTEPRDSLKMILDKSIPTSAFGYMDGKIRVKITGGTKFGTSAYKLARPDGTLISSIDSLSTDSVTQFSTIDNLYAGKYTIMAIDSLGCNTMLEAKVSQPDSLIVTTTKTQPKLACHGGKGEFVAYVKGGVKPYSYRWYVSTESGWKALLFTDSILTDITAGKYKVIVKDANKIEATAIDSIIQPSSVELTSAITNVGCKGNSDGSIKISLQGGAPPYTISMNNNDDYYSSQETDTSYTFKKLSAGDYYILVVDKNGCDGGIGKTKFSITQPAASLAIISSDSVLTTGYGKDSVNAKIQISGGTKPYKLTCDGDSIPFIYEDYTLISQLKSGNHILEVTDIHNCVISKSMFVTQPDSLLAEINESIGIRCNGSSGELIAKIKGGVAPYSYKWLANTTFGKDTLLATNATLNNINAGEYEVIVTDKNGNSVKATYTLLQPSLLTYGAKSTESVRCYGGSDGKASFNIAGGTGSYKITYLNSKIPTDSTIIYPFEYPYTLSDLKAGTYHYTITDINGCNGGVSQKSFSIGEKSKIKIELTSFIAPKGSISNDGTIGVKITNGIQPYNLIWTDGKGNVLPSIETAENGVVISKLSQLSEGVYKLAATDVNYSSANPNDACGSADTLVIDLKQPKPLELEIENLNPELKCHGDNNGMLIAHAKGGVTFTPPALAYKYEWYRKTTTGSDLVLSNGSILQKSSGGDYYLRITDLNGIYLESSLVTINEPAALDINFDITNVLCNKSATGRVVATPSGGIPPYTYSWNHTTDPGITTTLDDVAAGKYILTITDKNGCSIVKNAIVEQPAEMTVKVESIMPTCYKYTDGQINIKPSGGVAPYSVNWKDGSVTELKTGLGAGSYSFTVTDANGCTKSLTEVLTQPDSIRVMIDSKEVTLCVNQVAEYNIILPDDPQAVYQWYNSKGLIAETPAVILNDPDIYTAKITTSKGCKGQATTTIIRSNDLLNVDFVTASQVGKNKQVEIINITTPAPEKMKWLIPSTAAIKIVEQTNEKITLEFEENGDYSIGLKTFKGQCENTLYKTIKVVGDSELSDYQDGEEAYIKRFMVSSNPNDGNFKVWLEFSEKAEGNLYLINTEAAQLLDTRSFNNSSWYEFSYSNQFVPGVYILKLVTKKAQAYFKIIIH